VPVALLPATAEAPNGTARPRWAPAAAAGREPGDVSPADTGGEARRGRRRVGLPARAGDLAAALLLAAGGAALLGAPAGIAAGAALLARSLPAAAAERLQLPWSGALLAAAALLAGYPWLRPVPVVAGLEALGLAGGWGAAAAALLATGAAAAALALPGWPRRAAGAALALAAVAVVVAALPPRGRDLLRGRPAELTAAVPRWRHAVPGSLRLVRLETLLADGAALAPGTPVAAVTVESAGRRVGGFVLRAGRETGEWAAGRPDLRGTAPEGDAPIAWLPPPGEWFAHAYRASWRPPAPLAADVLRIERDPRLPAGVVLALRRVEVAR
jgi:hypothetical protein